MIKTNAMRLLDVNNIKYKPLSYDLTDGKIDGISVSKKLNKDTDKVYKTLIAGLEREYYVFIIPVSKELDLKKAAKIIGEKKIDLIPVKDIERVTGYVRGGCSPIGMKRELPTFIHEDALLEDSIIVSGGRIGSQIEILAEDLASFLDCKFYDLVK